MKISARQIPQDCPPVPGAQTLTKWRRFRVLTLLWSSVLSAQTAANWTKQTPQAHPSARSSFGMAYDSAHRQVVLFGGQFFEATRRTIFNDTWVWDGTNWIQKFP